VVLIRVQSGDTLLKTLDQALEVLKAFTRDKRYWGVRELAKELDLNHSVVYRILATFQEHGFLQQDKDTKKYKVGITFMEYAALFREHLQLSDMIYPIMKRLSEETGESIFLTWLDSHEGVCIEIYESSQHIKYGLSIGSRAPLFAGASNKIIMAYLSPEDQESIILKGLKSRSIKKTISKESLLASLKKIRQEGWAYSVGDYSDSVFGIAVPLCNRKNDVIASLTVAGPEYRMPEESVEKTLHILKRGRDEIQQILHNLT
jgi:IclR family KDG regulon transcriptional repressor